MGTSVVLVHGMYMTGASWAPWVERFAAADVEAVAPSWPYHDGDVQFQRAHPDPDLGRLTFAQVVDQYRAIVGALPERPALVGHSIGGLVVQILTNEGRSRCTVAVSPAPPQGVVSGSPHFLRANFPHVNPLAGNRPVTMDPERFHYAFANSMSRTDSDAMQARYAVPESRNVPRGTLGGAARIDFRKPHVPLLVLTGSDDHLTPVDMVRRNAERYSPDSGRTELRVYPGRSHALCLEPGWEGVADAALDWVTGSTT